MVADESESLGEEVDEKTSSAQKRGQDSDRGTNGQTAVVDK